MAMAWAMVRPARSKAHTSQAWSQEQAALESDATKNIETNNITTLS